ncbi:quinone oxidoreductase [Priestia flexa]|jgi:NADPH:quinone reductase|uniref:Quinone oxidoreductase n=1 Tax=Priestia flexa TaxID=86664 RepID=A0A8I1SNG5_9BACI|nr:quinone oxidoreductase [Priestia flexa]MBN8252065.1 quinone oxidoreductase [Priestia flexa]MBN8435012.1 quinone oxidoreductase [Priestia flexa]MCA0967486.1 quinone oxidoreductase [Priestia flexa]RIV04872.1 quinone oxidoreductase [Priestia flexa]UIR31922.1 quinone oxidoreductase [Priestia flexa]
MKAIQFKQYGSPDVLRVINLARPVPKKKDVLIKVEAIGVNYADTARREGAYVVDTPLPFIPGSEVAGEVVELGEEVEGIKVGMKVVTLLGSHRATGYAEYTLADSRGLIPLPDGVDLKQAAALPLQGLTAYHILKTMGRIEKGETVVVHAAAGGVGTLAVQLAKKFGANVIATASSDEKLAIAKRLGADVLINYTEAGWQNKVMEETKHGADVILEMVGGSIFYDSLQCLAPFGRLVFYGMASGQPVKFNPGRLMEKNQSVMGFFLPQMMAKPSLYQQSLQELLTYMKNGELELLIGGTYPLEDAAHVHRLLQGRKTTGKLILVP